MKLKTLVMTLCALAAFTVTSCKDEPKEPTPKPEEATLTVAPSSLSFGSASESKSLTVKSNKDWTVAVPSDASWLTASPMKGTGDGSVSVKAAANVGPDGTAAAAREAKISISIDGKKVDITVSQSAEAIVFVVNGDTATIPADGGKVAVSVEYNEAYTVGTLPEWITAGTKATKTDNLSFTVAANEAATERIGDITFSSASGKTGKVTVKQEGKKVATKSLATAQDLKDFAAAVNSGDAAAIAAYDPDGDGIFKLEADIAFGGETITPIGNGSYKAKSELEGAAFTGTFDGQGHTVDNFVINVAADAADNATAGFFGLANKAVIKNLKVGSKAVINAASTNAYHVGAVLGGGHDTDIIECSSSAKLVGRGSQTVTGTTGKKAFLGGVVGILAANTAACKIEKCSFDGSFDVLNETNANNGGTGFSVGGIAAFTDWNYSNTGSTTAVVTVSNCVNNANINVSATRVAGIVASANGGTYVENNTNKGNITATEKVADSTRPSGIVSAMGTGGHIKACINRGTITAIDDTANIHYGYAAGIIGQINADNCDIESCENYGNIRSDVIKTANQYIGAILVHANSKTVAVKNNKVEGTVGPVTEDETWKVVKITKNNFEDYITMYKANSKNAKVTFEGNYCTVEEGSTDDGPVIKTGDDLVAFFKDAENYKNPEYAVSFANDIDMNGLSIAPIDTLKCVIDGKNFSIKNWKCEKSAIAFNVGTIKNIVIDSSCELVVNDGNSAFLVDKNQPDGVIDGVINNASASRTDAITAQFNFGFISCINYGLIKNCVNNGNLTVDVPSMAKSFVGGVCGYYNGSTNVKALGSFVCFDNCKNTGNISIRSEAKPGNAEIGGIVGGTSCAKLSESYARGDIENCENSGNISYSFNANDSGTYVNEGGVTGIIEGSIKNCKNSGKVSYTNPVDSPKNSTRAAVGGVASYVRFNAEDCVNSGEVFVQGSHGAGTADAAYAGNQANPSFAGVIAQIGPATADATSDYHILRCYNTGKVTIDTHMQSTNSTTFWFGGVCAFATVDVIECHNSGALDVTAGQKSFTVGGVVGKPYHVVKDCYNEGPIDFKYTNVAQNGAWGIYLGGVAGDVEASGQPFTGCENKAAGTISVEGDFNASTTWYSYVGGLVGRFNKQASEISGCKNSAPVTIKKPGYFRCGGLVGSVDTKLLKNCQNTGDVTVPAALNLAVSFPCIGGFVGHCAALDIQECSSNAKVNVEASNDSNISLFAGSVGNTAQVWNNNSFGGELTVTGAATANHVGIMLGGLIDVNDAAKTVTIGAEKANVVKAGSKINGTAVTEADCADVTKVCGYFMPDDAFKAKVVLAEGGVVLEGGSTPDVPGTTPDIPGVDYNNPGVTL